MGALEDEDGEEDNVYGEETLTSYHSTLADDHTENMETTYGWTGKIQTSKQDRSIVVCLLVVCLHVYLLSHDMCR